ncbi:MAG: hypothetical protein GY838_13510 [bacterium]|nr:hypothetical protein [bacterium]
MKFDRNVYMTLASELKQATDHLDGLRDACQSEVDQEGPITTHGAPAVCSWQATIDSLAKDIQLLQMAQQHIMDATVRATRVDTLERLRIAGDGPLPDVNELKDYLETARDQAGEAAGSAEYASDSLCSCCNEDASSYAYNAMEEASAASSGIEEAIEWIEENLE